MAGIVAYCLSDDKPSLNLIRKGLKPLEPIALTPEEDAKLVSEGVLPAQ